jgi:hypothetical protein
MVEVSVPQFNYLLITRKINSKGVFYEILINNLIRHLDERLRIIEFNLFGLQNKVPVSLFTQQFLTVTNNHKTNIDKLKTSNGRSTAVHAIHLLLDISANGLEIRAIQSLNCIV